MPDPQPPSSPEDELLRKLNNTPTEFFASVEFPSDAITVARLRKVFPEFFDGGRLNDGFTAFFDPERFAKADEHLAKLNDLISAERTLVAYAVYDTFDPYPSKTLNEECRESYVNARKTLEEGYRMFRLADSPETARLLIETVESQGRSLAEQARGQIR